MATGGKLISDASGHVLVRALHDIDFSFFDGDRVNVQGNMKT